MPRWSVTDGQIQDATFTFALAYLEDGGSAWEWRNSGMTRGSFASFVECMKDASRHGYRGGGTDLGEVLRYSRGGRLLDESAGAA